ncbi:hypothetical protein EJ05DRAFT_475098 [Pseudovirgaria hyperparasitica]|uniref:Acyltransferase 3 domain-containing protein n=1 Tax=Pseudovirgaria hyperparasitica TaxID=470096 RepID=A0A6A6W9K2_9PEZI|nr:uncharacterized protein EJ05DRAFT_475098 [Pseudovirgaria hyperparasitica]KAF2758839.1 hypothetical protein EJ05DRAFT_475098 [Pseudovirgaria hyperparasitica]
MPYRSYWADPPEDNRHFIQLPPFRIVFAGQAMVDIFFVVSGYSVSIALIRARNRDGVVAGDFYRRLTSAVFRRFFRLFIPVLVLVTLSHLLYFLNLYTWIFSAEWGFPGCIPFTSPWSHLKWYLSTIASFAYLQTNQNLTLNDHLWTIPVEMCGSLRVYLAVLGFAAVRPRLRPWLVALVGLRLLWLGNPEYTAFIAGLTYAELDDGNTSRTMSHGELPRVTRAAEEEEEERMIRHTPPKTTTTTTTLRLRPLRRAITPAKWAMFAISIYLLCLPVENPFPADWAFQRHIRPPYWKDWEIAMRSWQTIGAVLFIGSVRQLPVLKRPFETRLAQTLGSVSFSLYLLHQTVYRTLLNRMLDWWSWVFLGDGYWEVGPELRGYVVGLVCVWILSVAGLMAVLAVGTRYMTRAVDQRSVVLAHRIEEWCCR